MEPHFPRKKKEKKYKATRQDYPMSGVKRKRSKKSKAVYKKRGKNLQSVAMDITNMRDADVLPIPRPALNFLPSTRKVTLRYAQKFSIVSNVAQASTHIFRANSMYDPDFSGLGHQPRGFDQLMAMYDHFTVVGSKITIMTAQPGTSAVVGISLQDDAVSTTDPENLLETRPDNSVIGVVAAGAEALSLSLGYSQKKFFGVGGIDDKYQGSNVANPEEGSYFHVWQAAINDTSSNTSHYVAVIDYIALLSEPQQPTKS